MKPYAGPEAWYEGEACPLSSDGTHVRTYDHGWCRVGGVRRTPSCQPPVITYAQCDCNGQKYPLRPRVEGDGNPGQQ